MINRVLIVDPNVATVRLLSDLLHNLGPCDVETAPSGVRGLAIAKAKAPSLIFVELKAPDLDGLEFTRYLRRSDYACRKAPVIMVTGEATAPAILGARDSGVHEFLRKPFTMGDLRKRIDAVTLRKRDWVEAISYIGPDRSRFNSADYAGPRKRVADVATPALERIAQALRIVRAATLALESDPLQALRALKAQADILVETASSKSEYFELTAMAMRFQAYLETVAAGGVLNREQVETFASKLNDSAPAEARPDAAQTRAA